MTRPWEADPGAGMARRLGKSPIELGNTSASPSCPDIWELDNGDFAVIGRDLTAAYYGSRHLLVDQGIFAAESGALVEPA